MIDGVRTRLACSVALAGLGGWTLQANVSPAFTPVRLEIAGARGFSRGLLNLVVLPADASFAHVAVWLPIAVGVTLLLLLLRAPAPKQGRLVTMSTALQAAAAVLLVAAVVSPFATPYRIVYAPRTFVLLSFLLVSSRIVRIGDLVGRGPSVRGAAQRVATWGAALVATAFFASMMLQQLANYGNDYTGFLHVSRERASVAPFLRERPDITRSLIMYDAGYDGQFMYLMAFDPFLRRFRNDVGLYRQVVDDPPYRYGRIGFSALTRLISAGSARRFPAVMVWLTVLAQFPLALALAVVARRSGRSPWTALAYLAIPAFAVSTTFALPEALAAAGLVAGFALWQRHRMAAAALCFAASLLVRETGLLLVLPLVAATSWHSRRQATWLAGALMPLIAWRTFVARRFFGEFGWHAILTSPGDLGAPFAGLQHAVNAGWTHAQAAPERIPAVVFPVVLTAALTLAVVALVRRRGPVQFAAVGYGIVAVSLNYTKIWHHLPSGERGTFEFFLCLLVIWLTEDGPSRLHRPLAWLFVVLCVYTFLVAPEAGASRAALLLIR